VFVFGPGAAGATVSTRDTITDFAPGEDLIDLSAPGGLGFVAGDSFGRTAGEVIQARGLLRIDLDGDGAAEMVVKPIGEPALTVDDLIL
jgi:Ca2+-binding RTX toxin-like protein